MEKVLIIDDNSDIRENMIELFELEGFLVIGASNGKEGESLAKSECPDIILCDIRMNNINGYRVLSDLKKNKSTSEIPFVFVSSYAEKKERDFAFKMGANEYITKPFDGDELIEKVRLCLENKPILDFYQSLRAKS